MATRQHPAAVSRANSQLKLWGDPVAGEVNDWIYAFGERLCSLVFSMPPGAAFTQSDEHKPVYGADELYYVLRGTLALANPRTGDVVHAPAGSALRFGRDTWHHGFNAGEGELQVLEFFAAAGAAETAAAVADGYGASLPLEAPLYARDDAAGDLTIELIDRRDWLWRLEGRERRTLVGVLVSSPALTVAQLEFPAGQSSDIRRHGGELIAYVLGGRLNVLCPDEEPARRWLELAPGDAFVAPPASAHRYFNMSDAPVRVLVGVSPSYLAEGT